MKSESPMRIVTEGTFILGGGLAFTSHSPRCLRIFLMTSSSSTHLFTRLEAPMVGQLQRGSVGGIHLDHLRGPGYMGVLIK